MKLRHPVFKILIHFLVFVKPLTEHRIVHRLTTGHYKSRIVLCDFENKTCAVLVKMVVFHPAEEVSAAHARQHYAVFDLAIADFPRRKQGS